MSKCVRWLVVMLGVWLPLAQAPAWGQGTSALVVEYRSVPAMLVEAQPLQVRVFADGAVEVVYPEPMRQAGVYRFALSPAEVDALQREVAKAAAFDAGEFRRRLADAQSRARQQGRILAARSDATIEEFVLQGAGGPMTLRLQDLDLAARRLSSWAPAQDLNRLRSELLALAERAVEVRP